ncbi:MULTISPECIES: PLP-dependent aspartate aminotransferase family protein [unclassified Carboxydocella]|uniref:trans-sulfuration enzyme family protein n=1 Tax=unclassified Carboxydocella TaxID=2685367 RepID=UPI0009ACBC16|nr:MULTISPECIES: PLP-dependent aspartate aminotransferase family protein [unclassified Carboxydocella]GAW29062.1 cystathionine gamma-synthase [Carboxydocella sp. ULO1]GAW31610.1 cystathionine gamma-synthase [Carboxydocella sp. JDF658]
MQLETILAQLGVRKDQGTGSITMPIYQTATFAHPAPGQSTGFDYSRSGNPTRQVLEEAIAALEGGCRGFAFSSGMAALTAVFQIFKPGDRILVCDDLYGGTYRLFEQILRPLGLAFTYLDFSNTSEADWENYAGQDVKAVFIETPTNPLMKIYPLSRLAQFCQRHQLLLLVDNTFMTPLRQRPLLLGADIVIHSASKYLGGHNDLIAGLVAVKDPELAERVYFYQNACGAILGPQDSWLLLRGLKTLAVRLERQEQNAAGIASYLNKHPRVRKVWYPGLAEHPGREWHFAQASGPGAMVSFEVESKELALEVLSKIRLISFAESLGGVESLLTYPETQTHADIPETERRNRGITDCLLRLSVGLEHLEDLLADLEQALGGEV